MKNLCSLLLMLLLIGCSSGPRVFDDVLCITNVDIIDAEQGFHADLLLLNSNPLDDIRITKDIDAVIKAGTFHSRAKFMSKLKQ